MTVGLTALGADALTPATGTATKGPGSAQDGRAWFRLRREALGGWFGKRVSKDLNAHTCLYTLVPSVGRSRLHHNGNKAYVPRGNPMF